MKHEILNTKYETNSKFEIRNSKSRSGFTLIEIIVSLGIFSVVAVIAIGALVRVVSANKQAQGIQSSVNNVSYALESMTREMRVGTSYHCEADANSLWGYIGTGLSAGGCGLTTDLVGGGNTVIAFYSANTATDVSGTCNLVYAYMFSVDGSSGAISLKKAQQSSCGQNLDSNDFFPVISPTVTITGYRVGVYGNDASHPHMWAIIHITGRAGIKVKDQTVFDVQTSVSERAQG